MDFGDYCLIEQKRYGCENEMYLHKVIGPLRSNVWVPVPVQSPATEEFGDEMADVIRCVCCGVSETEVRKYRVQDVKPNTRFRVSATINFNDDLVQTRLAPEDDWRLYECSECGWKIQALAINAVMACRICHLHTMVESDAAPERLAEKIDKRVCHAPGDTCLACPHYYGKADVCSYAPADAERESTDHDKRPTEMLSGADLIKMGYTDDD